MKIQELAIIFIIIILPISLLLSEYTQFQIQTIKLQTEYDARLISATYDAIKAFQLNATNSTTSDLSNSKMRDLEASIKTFRNSIMTGFELNGYTEEDLNNYIPALVYTLYDGFYIYSPYKSTHDELGDFIEEDSRESIYGLKPYINYSCRYKNDNGTIDVIITYALDNYITVQGKIDDNYVNKSGYLIDGITIDGDTVKYNDIEIQQEQLKENLLGRECSYAKINGTKYYLVEDYTDDGKDCIVYILNGTLIVQYEEFDEEFTYWKNKIVNNDSAKQYYREAYEFTRWLREETDLDTLTYANAIDEVITKDADINITNVWPGENTLIFGDDPGKNIENESSNYNQHRLNVIRHKIETNLAIAIANYNNYSGVSSNVFQMPKLKENEWDNIAHNISLISFLQGLHIGGKVYNGYSLVTNSESKEVVVEDNIYILGQDIEGNKAYHKIGDKGFENGTLSINSGEYGESRSAGRLNLDFERRKLTNNNISYYYYPLKAYNASYDSIVMQNNVTTYDDIYEYVNGQNYALKEAFYTALGRERVGKYNSKFNYADIAANNVGTIGLIRHYDATNNTGDGHDSSTRIWKDLTGNYDVTLLSYFGWNNGGLQLCAGDVVSFGDLGALLNGFTIETEIKGSDFYSFYYGFETLYKTYLSKYVDEDIYRMYVMGFSDEGNYSLPCGANNLSEEWSIEGDYLPLKDKYITLATTWNQDTHAFKTYLNGQLVGETMMEHYAYTDEWEWSPVVCGESSSMGIMGELCFGNDGLEDVSINKIKIYDRALTADEIYQNFAVSEGSN